MTGIKPMDKTRFYEIGERFIDGALSANDIVALMLEVERLQDMEKRALSYQTELIRNINRDNETAYAATVLTIVLGNFAPEIPVQTDTPPEVQP